MKRLISALWLVSNLAIGTAWRGLSCCGVILASVFSQGCGCPVYSITTEQQADKIRLVIEVAEEVWGSVPAMADFDDVRRIALALPDVREGSI